MGSWLVWDPAPKNGSIASLEQDAHSAPQVGGSFPLILASVAGKSRSQLLPLRLGIWVPKVSQKSPKSLSKVSQRLLVGPDRQTDNVIY